MSPSPGAGRLEGDAAVAVPGGEAFEGVEAHDVAGEHAGVAVAGEDDDVAAAVAQLPQLPAGDGDPARVGWGGEGIAGDDGVRDAMVHVRVEDGLGTPSGELVVAGARRVSARGGDGRRGGLARGCPVWGC